LGCGGGVVVLRVLGVVSCAFFSSLFTTPNTQIPPPEDPPLELSDRVPALQPAGATFVPPLHGQLREEVFHQRTSISHWSLFFSRCPFRSFRGSHPVLTCTPTPQSFLRPLDITPESLPLISSTFSPPHPLFCYSLLTFRPPDRPRAGSFFPLSE